MLIVSDRRWSLVIVSDCQWLSVIVTTMPAVRRWRWANGRPSLSEMRHPVTFHPRGEPSPSGSHRCVSRQPWQVSRQVPWEVIITRDGLHWVRINEHSMTNDQWPMILSLMIVSIQWVSSLSECPPVSLSSDDSRGGKHRVILTTHDTQCPWESPPNAFHPPVSHGHDVRVHVARCCPLVVCVRLCQSMLVCIPLCHIVSHCATLWSPVISSVHHWWVPKWVFLRQDTITHDGHRVSWCDLLAVWVSGEEWLSIWVTECLSVWVSDSSYLDF